jgi:hypothetical protein
LSGTTEVDDVNFTPEENERWKELEAAEEKQEQSRQNSDGSGNDEQRFAHLFADANKKIDKLVSDANQKKDGIDADLKKSIKKIVQDLASNLKALGFPVHGIANAIVHQLNGRGGSRSWIHEILADEYKNKTYQENARKRWKRKVAPAPVQKQQITSPSDGHENTPVQEQKQQIIVGLGGHEITDTGSGDLPSEQTKEGGSRDLPMHYPSRQEQDTRTKI